MNDLGNPTPKYPLTLNRGEDYTRPLVTKNGVFPADARIYIRFDLLPVVEWEYVVEGNVATIHIESELVDQIPTGTLYQLMTDTPADTELCWGIVKRSH